MTHVSQFRWTWCLLCLIALAACSSFKRTEETVPASVPATWGDVRTSPGHTEHVGKRGLACSSCHETQDGGFKNLGDKACPTCHAAEDAKHHQGGAVSPTRCLDCHSFGTKPSQTCLPCHDTKQGNLAAITHHRSERAVCTECHKPHKEPSLAAIDCKKCHEKIVATHGRKVVNDHVELAGARKSSLPGTGHHDFQGNCTDCHKPHAPAEDALLACTNCHSSEQGKAPPSGHAACVSCHAPHDLQKGDVKACTSCHEAKAKVPQISGHDGCKGCHVPHDVRGASTRCQSCHADHPALASTKVAAHAACDSCHAPHASRESAAFACANCHKDVHPTHGKGPTSRCTDCHSPHPRATSATVARACSSCHKAATNDHAFHVGHLDCGQCHKPHEFSKGATAATCTGCHASEAKLVGVRSGHADCAKCHVSAHTPNKVPRCATCHEKQERAIRGHADCAKCHGTHDGQTKREAACTNCHALGKLEGLHRIQRANSSEFPHTDCKRCHTAHSPPRADRAICLSCHKDKERHQPGAAVCSGCHVFRD